MEIVRPRQTYQPSIQKTRKWSPATSEAIKKNVKIISVISFIEETMKTLNRFGEQLKIRLDSNLIQ